MGNRIKCSDVAPLHQVASMHNISPWEGRYILKNRKPGAETENSRKVGIGGASTWGACRRSERRPLVREEWLKKEKRERRIQGRLTSMNPIRDCNRRKG